MHVLPATGWCGLAGTCFPRDKPDLRESKEKALGGEVKSWERQRASERTERRLFLYPMPIPSTHCIAFGAPPPALPQGSATLGVVLINASVNHL